MKRIGAAILVSAMFAVPAISGERTRADRADEDNFVLFSGGIPAIEVRSNPGNKACPFEIRKPKSSRASRPVFAVY